jgi:hypothetical protein
LISTGVGRGIRYSISFIRVFFEWITEVAPADFNAVLGKCQDELIAAELGVEESVPRQHPGIAVAQHDPQRCRRGIGEFVALASLFCTAAFLDLIR